jgi:hypothetical protein
MAGAATTLTVIALLALVILRPAEIAVAPYPDIIEFATIVPERTPDVPHPVAQPAPKIDLPMPVVALKLPEFATPVETPALPALALNPSPDAVARPSGAEAPYGKKDGTGRIAGSNLKPPVRRAGLDDSFPMSTRKDVGLVTSLNFCVTDKGRVRDVQLAVTSGFSDMDSTAARWLERERFRPGTLDGVATTMCATYDIRWVYSKATRAEAQAAGEAHAAVVRERSRYPRQFVPWPYDRPFPGCDAVDICRADGK